jgi:hypothetical protein
VTNFAVLEALSGSIASAASLTGATLDQCTNGAVGPPIDRQPCQGSNITGVTVTIPGINGGAATSYKNWVNGDSNGNKSHWREGDFISYRAIIGGITAGTHTLVMTYSPERSGLHAIDYLGSFDSTETTSTTPSTLQANNNNPCSDLAASGGFAGTTCDPTTPTATIAVPNADLGNGSTGGPGTNTVCGAPGTFNGQGASTHQIPGSFKLFGPAGTTFTGVSYLSQNVNQGGGTCNTTVSLSFNTTTAIDANHALVIAWGGHISTEADWGFSNTASYISGSPYHMALNSLDGASTGAQDRALASSAVFFTPSITTQVMVNGAPLGNPATPIALGSTVNDTATITGASPVAGGTVTYNRFTNGTCNGTPGTTQTVTVTEGSSGAVVPPSSTFVPGPGSYSYDAVYSGDTGSNTLGATSACEPFQVGGGTPTLTTHIINDANSMDVTGQTVPLGTSVHDTAIIGNQVAGFPASGTVTYDFFHNGTCAGTGTTQVVTVTASGTVPPSASTGALGAGSYSYLDTYSGDSIYPGPVTATCEVVNVSTRQVTVTTDVFNNAGGPAVTGGTVPLGSSVHDTGAVNGQLAGFPATGTFTYVFYNHAGCTGTPVSTQTVGLNANGTVPNSASTAALAAGSYGYIGTYSGDGNYPGPIPGACEPFTVPKVQPVVTTDVFNDLGGPAVTGGTVPLGSSVHDTAVVGNQTPGFPASGSYTYSFFTNGTCSGTPATTQTVTLNANGTVPDSASSGPLAAGSYGYSGSYGGDSNYLSAPGGCEPFTVAMAHTATTTDVFNDQGGPAVTGGQVPLGSSVHDTAVVTGQVLPAFPATGTYTYTFFTNGTCSGSGTPQVVTLNANGSVPPSASTGPLAAGSYSYGGSYSGDANYFGSSGGCEPFTVPKVQPVVTTDVFNDLGGPAVTGGTAPLGSSVHDTAVVGNQTAGFPASGSYTYSFFTNGTCSGTPATTQTVTLNANGTVPDSASTGPLGSGAYGYSGSYGGDTNYLSAPAGCEPFSIEKVQPTVTTDVFNDLGGPAVTGGTVPLGSSVHDTAVIGNQTAGFPASGSYTYTFFHNGTCSGTGTPQVVTLNSNGTVPPSASTGPLGAGAYSYSGSYGGDGNYLSAPGGCEPFTVPKVQPVVTTDVFNDLGGPAVTGGTVPLGSSVHDTAIVGNQTPGFPASGSYTYTFFTNGTCSGSGTPQLVSLNPDGTVPDSAPTGPLAAGAYSYSGSYGGDGNYLSAPGGCEPFTVPKVQPVVTTDVFNDLGGPAVTNGSVPLGSSVHDTAVVGNQTPGFPASGSYTYRFFTNGTCTGTPATTQTVTLNANGTVPDSASTGPLASGAYGYSGSYGGDSNYLSAPGACEPFSVGPVHLQLATDIFNDLGGPPVTGGIVTLGSSVHDTATLAPQTPGFPATGGFSYGFFSTGSCSGAFTPQGVGLNPDGTVPNSVSTGPLGAGSYSYFDIYSGDKNYPGPVTGPCEPVTVPKVQPSVTTDVFNDLGGPAITGGTAPLGSSVHDTAVVGNQTPGFPALGSYTYTFFHNGTCSGTGTSQVVPMNPDGTVPDSAPTGPLGAGAYSYSGSYSGDSNYLSAPGGCEPFTIPKVQPVVTTDVFNDLGGPAVTGGSVPLGSSVHDTAVVGNQTPGFPASGSYTYTFFANGTCSGTPATTQTVGLNANGTVPDSATTGPLGAGTYGYSGSYGGDSNYLSAPGGCEPFTVLKAQPVVTTDVFNDLGGPAITGGTTPLGSSVHDTAVVGNQTPGFPASGSYTYTFFTNGTCSGTPLSTQTVGLNPDGTVPDSAPTGPLAAGSYGYSGSYGGDSNYLSAPGGCEPFMVPKAQPVVTTDVFNDLGGPAVTNGSVPLGSSVHDTAIVGNQTPGFPASGSYTYTFFTNGTCAGTGTSQVVTLNLNGTVPPSASTGPLAVGNYSYSGSYGGDSNYLSAPGGCEPFSVNPRPTTTTTDVFFGSTDVTNGSVPLGSSVHDTAVVGNQLAGFPAGGTFTYQFFNHAGCSGSPVFTEIVGLNADGTVPPSESTGPLGAGSYGFVGTYSGDSNYGGSSGGCEPFNVPKTPTVVTSDVFSGSTDVTNGSVPFGSSVYDTAVVSGQVTGFPASGSFTYVLYASGSCTGTPLTTQTVALNPDGTVPNSAPTGPITTPGTYGYLDTYGGDGNYNGTSGTCEPFTVQPLPPISITTAVTNDAGGANVTNGTVPLGTSVHDTAPITGITPAYPPTGTLTYQFFKNGTCTGTAFSTQTVTLTASGQAPNSASTGPLGAGFYGYLDSYSGDPNFVGEQLACEPFQVLQRGTTVTTHVINAANGQDVTNQQVASGSTVYDTATVNNQLAGIPATGTVTYYFFTNGTCTFPAASSQQVTLNANGTVPNSASHTVTSGAYAFQAVYSGDANYTGSTGGCEPFSVGTPPLTPGYWKNHLSVSDGLIASHQPFYIGHYLISGTPSQISASVTAIFANMNCSNSSQQNAIGCLAGQLLAAELNLANGAPTTIQLAVNTAQQFLGISGSPTLVTYKGLTAVGVVYTGPTATFTLTAAQRALALALDSDISAYNASGV